MIEKISQDLVNSSKRHYERELARPRYDFYTKVKSVDGKPYSLESATFCDSIENFLADYKSVSETLNSNGYLDGRADEKKAFVNIFSLYAAAADASHRLKKISGQWQGAGARVGGEQRQYDIQLDFTQGAYSLTDQLILQVSNNLGKIKGSEEMIEFASAYFSSVISKTKELSKNPDFEGMNGQLGELQLQIGELVLNGFNFFVPRRKEYSFSTSLEDIVGNEEMISTLKRAVRNLLKYDPESKQNVMQTHFDGFQRTFTFYGEPGCGKTATIEAIMNYATNLAEKACKSLAIENVTNAFKSEYYSKSTQNLKEIFDRINEGQECHILVFEDIDTILFSRDELKNRPEDKAILGTIMNYLEGLEAPRLGNDLVIVTTNNPLCIDGALLSRLGEGQIYVPGPKTAEDFAKLLKIKMRKSISSGLVNLTEQEWQELGKRCADADLSGRDAKNVSRVILGNIYDKEEPAEVLKMRPEDQVKALRQVYSNSGFEELKMHLDLYLINKSQMERF